jgi:hypothetical protein
MKYILPLPGGGWDLAGYIDYITTCRDAMPAEVFSFASDIRNFDLTSHQSLHDAWLEWFMIKECASGSRSENRSIQLECLFLGPYHDQYIELKYLDVDRYRFSFPGRQVANSTVAHGDLLMHEVRLEDGRVVHQMEFSNGAEFEICCRVFEHRLIKRKCQA